ncbi:MAG: metalloregulator ArsR/SmtB family transcription factor [Vicinamibacterales bacterium]
MKKKPLGPDLLARVADRFKVLAEPARLTVLNALREGPLHVSALMDKTGLNQANLSKHLQLLHAHGYVARRRQGVFIHYQLADNSVFALCDIMCGQLERKLKVESSQLKLKKAS